MTTQGSSLYAARAPIFPRRVAGRFRRLKWQIMAVTLAIYYVTPWLRWDRGIGRPDQAVLVDLAHRRFYFFWIEIWPQEFYFVAGLLVMAGLGLFLFTAALGRVWCGYACPQTVWTDLFLLVERRLEGDRNAQKRLHAAPWTFHKLRLRLTKWSIWLLIGLVTGGAWTFYFTDAPTLARELLSLSAPPVAWMTIALLTATTFVLGGFMREQVCMYMCPWPRIQGAMMDEDTLTVAYRDWRGEPRGKGLRRRAAPAGSSPGDCIDCDACVAVCPMGIDIRDGQQMGCITCALCIDACDEVMERIGRPRGLIDYLAPSDAPAERQGGMPLAAWRHVLRPRNLVYATLWAGIGLVLGAALYLRPDAGLSVAPVRNPTYVLLSDGAVRNAYELRLRNMSGRDRYFTLSLEPAAGLSLTVEGQQGTVLRVPADTQRQARIYITAGAGSTSARRPTSPLQIRAYESGAGASITVATTFNGKSGS